MITISCPATGVGPRNPDPWEVFDERPPPNKPVDLLSGNLHRYDHEEQRYATYHEFAPSDFGLIMPGDGYWLWLFEDEIICYEVERSEQLEAEEVYFPEAGWYLIGSPQPCHTYIEDTQWHYDFGGAGQSGPHPFSDIYDLWVQDPLVGYSCELGGYDYTGLKGTDDYTHLHQFQGYWLYTFVEDVTVEIPPP